MNRTLTVKGGLTAGTSMPVQPARTNGRSAGFTATAAQLKGKRHTAGLHLNAVRKLLDPRMTSSLSLAALAEAVSSTGQRLVVEIRDERPVRVVRTASIRI